MSVEELEVEFVGSDGVTHRRLLAECGSLIFEDLAPVIVSPSYRGQRNRPGWWWSATTGQHVAYNSRLERDHLMALDFDREIVALAARPLRLVFRDGRGRERRHVPAIFTRRRDDSVLLTDCRGDGEGVVARQAAAFEVAERACSLMGWGYRCVGGLDRVHGANLRWLSGYRHPRYAIAETTDRLLATFAVPRPLLAGAVLCGDQTAVLPVLFHLLWHHRLHVDPATPLTEASIVSTR